MAYANKGTIKDQHITGSAFVPLDALAGACQPGPLTKDIVRVMGKSIYLARMPVLEPNLIINTKADAFASNPVLICMDEKSPHYGIWGLNAVGTDEIENWEKHPELGGAPWGFYMMLYSVMPTARQWIDAGAWSPGAEAQCQDYAPALWEQIRVLRGFPPTASAQAGASTLPPGLKSGVIDAAAVDRGTMELSVKGSTIWAAKTPQESAANKTGNPHPGVSVINPGDWERVTGGKAPKDAFDWSEEMDRGWTGLDGGKFLAYDKGDADAHIAQEEIWSLIEAAEAGHDGARKALKYVGITGPEATGPLSGDGWLSHLFR